MTRAWARVLVLRARIARRKHSTVSTNQPPASGDIKSRPRYHLAYVEPAQAAGGCCGAARERLHVRHRSALRNACAGGSAGACQPRTLPPPPTLCLGARLSPARARPQQQRKRHGLRTCGKPFCSRSTRRALTPGLTARLHATGALRSQKRGGGPAPRVRHSGHQRARARAAMRHNALRAPPTHLTLAAAGTAASTRTRWSRCSSSWATSASGCAAAPSCNALALLRG
jgi:hypothetical protein